MFFTIQLTITRKKNKGVQPSSPTIRVHCEMRSERKPKKDMIAPVERTLGMVGNEGKY